MKKPVMAQSGLLAFIVMLAGGFLTGFMGCSDDGTTVKVETTPSAAKVFIDGKFVGLSPCECFVRDSQPEDLWEQHVIEVKAKGYESQSRRLRYRTGAAWLPDKIEFVMSPSPMLDDSDIPQTAKQPADAETVTRIVREDSDAKSTGEETKTAETAADKTTAKETAAAPEIHNATPAVPEETPDKKVEKPVKKFEYKSISAMQRKRFRSSAPWAKAAPVNDDHLAQPQKKSIQQRHAEMEKAIVRANDGSGITAPKLPELAPDGTEQAQEVVEKMAEGPDKTTTVAKAEKPTLPEPSADGEEETPIKKAEVPLTRPRLTPLPKQVKAEDKSRRNDFIGSVPWKGASSQSKSGEIEVVSAPIDRHITSAAATRKDSPTTQSVSGAVPWAQAGGLSNAEDSESHEPRAANEPENNRLFSCDLRIARVSDGVVLRQASGVDTYANLEELAQDLVDELAAFVPDNASVAIFCFHNRRNTESGMFVADKMLEATVAAVRKSSGLLYVKTVNIRDALNSEMSLEQAKQLTKPRFYPLLKNAEYVIIGGVSLFDNFAEVASRPEQKEENDKD